MTSRSLSQYGVAVLANLAAVRGHTREELLAEVRTRLAPRPELT